MGSISHENDYAIGMVICEKIDNDPIKNDEYRKWCNDTMKLDVVTDFPLQIILRYFKFR